MKTFRGIVLLCGLAFAGAGCISMPKMLPAEYFAPPRTLAIEVTDCPAVPTLRTDQPAGTLAGATWLVRVQAMNNRMAGITPDMVQQAIRRALEKPLAGTFTLADRDAQLVLKVSLNDWGWYVPTGKFGESTDIHYFRLGGTSTIVDPAQNGETVFFTYNSTDTPLGDRLTKEKCEATLPKAAEDFAAQIARFILKGKPPE